MTIVLKTPDVFPAQMWEVTNTCHVKVLFKDEVTGHSLEMVTSINDRHGKASTYFQVWKTSKVDEYFPKKIASSVLDSAEEAVDIYNRLRIQWHKDAAFEALSDEEQDMYIAQRQATHLEKYGK